MATRVLNVAEKPSVARAAAAILGQGHASQRSGRSKYNPIFEFPYELRGRSVTMVFTSVTGHLMEMDFEPPYDRNWSQVDPLLLFEAPIQRKVPDDKAALKQQLQAEARNCQWLVLWLDGDREGEAISFEVMEVCQAVNPRMQVYRARFSAIIARDLHEACRNLDVPNQRWSHAVEARQEIDLRLGAVFTRFQTLRLQRRFAQLGSNRGVISYGPCQFPTLGFVVERWKQRQNFVPESFWKMELVYSAHAGRPQGHPHPPPPDADRSDTVDHCSFTWKRGPLFDHQSALVLYEMCCDAGIAVVEKCEERDTKKLRPIPLSTVELQKRASRWLRMSSEQTMKVAEKLYNEGFISYPRTETTFFKEGTDLKGLLEKLQPSQQFGAYVNGLLHEGKYQHPSKGKGDDQAHPPIHPTKLAEGLDGDSKRLYEFIVRHFLAVCSQDAKGKQTTYTVRMGDERFVCNGLAVHERNYLEIYVYENWNGSKVPVLRPGQTFVPESLMLRSGSTTAPTLLTEADLIAKMDKAGIGTDATIAQHIQKVLERGYVEVVDRYFQPSHLGVGLVDGYDAMDLNFVSPKLRAVMERDMNAIALGEKTKDDVVRKCLTAMRQTYQEVVAKAELLDHAIGQHFAPVAADQNLAVLEQRSAECGHCQQPMQLRGTRDDERSRALVCQRCQQSHPVPNGDLSLNQVRCPICRFQVLDVRNAQRGTTHTVCPWCYSRPPPRNGAPEPRGDGLPDLEDLGPAAAAAAASGGFFRCFNCVNPSCSLASGTDVVSDRPVMDCDCGEGSLMLVRRVSQGRLSLGLRCSSSPQCRVWVDLARCTDAQVTQTMCPQCGPRRNAMKLELRFKPGSAPPHLGVQYVGCLAGCEEDLNTVFNIRPGVRRAGAAPGGVAIQQRQYPAPAGAGVGAGMSRGSSASSGAAASWNRSPFNQEGVFSRPAPGGRQQVVETVQARGEYDRLKRGMAGSDAGRGSAAPGGGGPAKPDNVCYNCQQPGHWSSSCPLQDKGGRGAASSSRSARGRGGRGRGSSAASGRGGSSRAAGGSSRSSRSAGSSKRKAPPAAGGSSSRAASSKAARSRRGAGNVASSAAPVYQPPPVAASNLGLAGSSFVGAICFHCRGPHNSSHCPNPR